MNLPNRSGGFLPPSIYSIIKARPDLSVRSSRKPLSIGKNASTSICKISASGRATKRRVPDRTHCCR